MFDCQAVRVRRSEEISESFLGQGPKIPEPRLGLIPDQFLLVSGETEKVEVFHRTQFSNAEIIFFTFFGIKI